MKLERTSRSWVGFFRFVPLNFFDLKLKKNKKQNLRLKNDLLCNWATHGAGNTAHCFHFGNACCCYIAQHVLDCNCRPDWDTFLHWRVFLSSEATKIVRIPTFFSQMRDRIKLLEPDRYSDTFLHFASLTCETLLSWSKAWRVLYPATAASQTESWRASGRTGLSSSCLIPNPCVRVTLSEGGPFQMLFKIFF